MKGRGPASPQGRRSGLLFPRMALVLAGGITIGYLLPAQPRPALVAVALATVLWSLCLLLGRRVPASVLAWVTLFLAGAALVSVRLGLVPPAQDLSRFVGATCAMEGRIVGPARGFRGGHSVRVECERVSEGEETYRVSGAVRVWVYGAGPDYCLPGDRVRAELRLRKPPGRRFPGGSSQRLALAAEGIHFSATVDAGPRFAVSRGVIPFWWRPSSGFNRGASLVFAGLGHPADGLLHALILGKRDRLDPSLEEAFRLSGLAHILSVSGLHVSLAGLFVYQAGVFLMRRWSPLSSRMDVRRPAALAAIPLVIFYTMVTGGQPPAVRSCVMAVIFLLGMALVRSPDGVNSLCLAALLIMVASPPVLLSASFQLSFLAAWWILQTADRLPGLFGEAGGGGAWWSFRTGIFRYLAVSLAAFAGTAPLTSFYFALITPLGILASLAAVPLCGWMVLPFGLAAGFAAPVSGSCARILALPAAWGCRLMGSLAGFFANLDLFQVRDVRLTPAQVVGAFLLLLAFLFRDSLRRNVVLAAGILSLAVSFGMAQRGASGFPRAAFLDVGNGDACLVQFAGGRGILVDAGGSGDAYDRGRTVVLPAMRALGASRLDAMVITHAHPDHAGGANSVLLDVPTETVVMPRPGSEDAVAVLGDWNSVHGAEVRLVEEGDRFLAGGGMIDVLGPPGTFPGPQPASVNDASLVFCLRGQGTRILFAGDAGRQVLDRFAERYGELLTAELLKVPHHGSKHSWSERFAAAVAPSLAVIPAGNNPYGHPDPAVVEGLRMLGARVVVTGREGSLLVEGSPGGTAVTIWSGRDERLSPRGFAHWFLNGY